jgi:hypothetical protein
MLVLNRSGGGYRTKHMQKCKRDLRKEWRFAIIEQTGRAVPSPDRAPIA